jgi:transposase
MAICDREGRPLSVEVTSASPHEVTLVEQTLEARFTEENPEILIGDGAYDSDPLDEQLEGEGITLVAPHRANRVKPKTQDGRTFRRYKRRWKVERLNAWLQNFRKVTTRYEIKTENFLAFVQFAACIILARAL